MIELLAILSVIALLAAALVPARAASRTRSQSVRCLENLRQIMAATSMYTYDNHDFFPPNPDDGNVLPGHNWCAGMAGAGASAEFNPDLLADPRRCLITTYLHTNVSVFRCTADTRVGRYTGADPAKVGTQVPAVRSISMSQAVGTICRGFDVGGGHSGKPTLSVNGPWLDNMGAHRRNNPWRTYGKTSEAAVPIPAKLWVIIEEDPDSLNDGSFAAGMVSAVWIDFPSTLHSMACTIAFMDGRAELHKWVDARTKVVSHNVTRRAVPGSADWLWLSERTSARAK